MPAARLAVSASLLCFLAAACAPVDSIDPDSLPTASSSSATGAGGAGGSGGAGGASQSATGAGGDGGGDASSSSGSGAGGEGPVGVIPDGGACASPAACISGVCSDSVCQVPTCTDGVANGAESGVDCGLACGAVNPLGLCASGAGCGAKEDCYNGRCEGGVCGVSLLGDHCLSNADCDGDLKCNLGVTGTCILPDSCANDLSNQIVISQVYGGGGGASSLYARDFVELHNRGQSAILLGGWTLQVTTGAGTTWTSIPLKNLLEAGRFYLIALGPSGAGTALPPADAEADTVTLDAAAGKVALVRDATPVSGACPSTGGAVGDLIVYGAGACESVASLDETKAVRRKAPSEACLDTNAATDLEVVTTFAPRNTGTAPVICRGNCE